MTAIDSIHREREYKGRIKEECVCVCVLQLGEEKVMFSVDRKSSGKRSELEICVISEYCEHIGR